MCAYAYTCPYLIIKSSCPAQLFQKFVTRNHVEMFCWRFMLRSNGDSKPLSPQAPLWRHPFVSCKPRGEAHQCVTTNNTSPRPNSQPWKEFVGWLFPLNSLVHVLLKHDYVRERISFSTEILSTLPSDLRNWQLLVGNDWLFWKMKFQRLKPKIPTPQKKSSAKNHRPLWIS